MILASAGASLVLVATALAQAPVEEGYGGEGGGVQEEIAGEAVAGAGLLPFTGLDLFLLFAAGALLAVAGITMRRVAKERG